MNIIAQLQGGLGNQLFQYATARALANRLQAHLELDTAWFEDAYADVTKRDVHLSELRIDTRLICQTPLITRPKRIRRILQHFLPLTPYVYCEHRPYSFERQLSQIHPYQNQDLYLLGYWQSYKYFSPIREQLINEIRPRYDITSAYRPFLTQIQKTSAAMVHIRRGDYVNLSAASKVHGFLGLEYYKRGMTTLLERNSDIQFFIFSDDLQWAQENLPFQKSITYIQVSPVATSASQELFLMSQCQYHLIANSSLSWWGAWLAHGNNALEKVISPKHWTNDRHTNWDDLLPHSWERI